MLRIPKEISFRNELCVSVVVWLIAAGLHHGEAPVIRRRRSCRLPIKLLLGKDAMNTASHSRLHKGRFKIMDVATAAVPRTEVEGSPGEQDGRWIYS